MSRKYIGYGYTYTKNKDTYNPKYSPVYKKLRAAFLDDIRMEVGNQFEDKRQGLIDYVTAYVTERQEKIDAGKPYEEVVLVFASLESLGNSPTDAADNASMIFGCGIHILILDHPEMSSIDIKGNVRITLGDPRKACRENGMLLFDQGDQKAIEDCVQAMALSAMGKHGRKSVSIDIRFRTAYWAWQNYFISTIDAIRLSGMSNATFYLSCDRYRNAPSIDSLYEKDAADCLEFYPMKPIRGIPLEEKYEKVIVECQRKYGEFWNRFQVEELCRNRPMAANESFDFREVERERLKYLHGRGCVPLVMKEFGKGPDYVKHLEEKLRHVDKTFDMAEVLMVHPLPTQRY